MPAILRRAASSGAPAANNNGNHQSANRVVASAAQRLRANFAAARVGNSRNIANQLQPILSRTNINGALNDRPRLARAFTFADMGIGCGIFLQICIYGSNHRQAGRCKAG